MKTSLAATPFTAFIPQDDDAIRLKLTVIERRSESEGVVSLTLMDPTGRPLPEWSPGAHIDVHIGGILRQYSLCSAIQDRSRWRLGILRAGVSRGGSSTIHDRLYSGSTVEVSYPRNSFVLLPSSRYVFVAGGIGITPILPMIMQAERDGSDWNLIYAGRSRTTMAFLEELIPFGDKVRLISGDINGRFDFTGYFRDAQEDTLIYACGPESMLATLESATEGWPIDCLHTERFRGKDIATTGDTAFDVEFTVSGFSVNVPANKTILQVAEEHNIPIISSCGEGTCGTCETTVLSGDVEHRDSILTGQDRETSETMFICVSRSKGGCPLRLDL